VLRPLEGRDHQLSRRASGELDAVNNPEDPAAGTRQVPFSRELYIERDDFHGRPAQAVLPPRPRQEVRLRYAYFIKCEGFVKDPARRAK
jgi:glutaminyl-tRNA synthetase